MEVKIGYPDQEHNPSGNTSNEIRQAGLVDQVFLLVNKKAGNQYPIGCMHHGILYGDDTVGKRDFYSSVQKVHGKNDS